MSHIPVLLFFVASLIIFIQDIRGRYIHVYTVIFFALATLVNFLLIFSIEGIYILYNLLFLALLYAISGAILLLRKKKIGQLIGKGDVIYLILLAFWFDFPPFVIWLNIALVFALLIHIFLNAFDIQKNELIPLAGYLSVVFCVAIFYENYVSSITRVIYKP